MKSLPTRAASEPAETSSRARRGSPFSFSIPTTHAAAKRKTSDAVTAECPQEPRKKPTTSTTASLEIAAAHGTTPERPQSPDETADPLRDVPCIRRVLSAVYEGSRGDCREHPSDTVTCCLQCSDGHKCTPVPAPLAGASLALLGSIQAKHEVEKVTRKARIILRDFIERYEREVGEEEVEEEEVEEEEVEEVVDETGRFEEDETAEDEERLPIRSSEHEVLKNKVKEGLCALVELIFEAR